MSPESQSALRSSLIALGPVVAMFGWANEATWGAIVGVLMILIPAAHGIWSARKNRAEAVNAGIAMSNAQPDVTPPVTAAEAKDIVKEFKAEEAKKEPYL